MVKPCVGQHLPGCCLLYLASGWGSYLSQSRPRHLPKTHLFSCRGRFESQVVPPDGQCESIYHLYTGEVDRVARR